MIYGTGRVVIAAVFFLPDYLFPLPLLRVSCLCLEELPLPHFIVLMRLEIKTS